MAKYFTKERLYDEVHMHKAQLGLSEADYGFNMVEQCVNSGILLDRVHFQTKALRGMASVGSSPDKDVILLNDSRTEKEQNLDCGHEYVHLCIHRDLGKRSFYCIDTIYAKQDEFLEWQANEGAAEILVPYRTLLPLIKANVHVLSDGTDIVSFKTHLASIFNVTYKVIEYRLEGLKYEIEQFLNGVYLDDIKILSLTQQQKNKINIKSINELESDLFRQKLASYRNSKILAASTAYQWRTRI